LVQRGTPQAEAQIAEVLDKAYEAELECSKVAAQNYAASTTIEDLRGALLAKLRLALVLSWIAETDARNGDKESAHEMWLESLDLARFTFDATTGDPDLTGMRAGAANVTEEILADLQVLRDTYPALTTDQADAEVEDGDRVQRTQIATKMIETALDNWEGRKSRKRTFDGVDVVEAVDGSTAVEVRTDRDSWQARSVDDRRSTFTAVEAAVRGSVAPGPIGYVLKLVDKDGTTLIATRMPRDLAALRF